MKDLAKALRETLISPNVFDSNSEPANVVDAINALSYRIERGLMAVANALSSIASAIRDQSQDNSGR